MPFTTRNARYLRISAHTVLPLYIYLDEKHVDWMSDYVLQCVLEDLRPKIGPKLQAEGFLPGSKKGTVDVYRGDSYQFAYFFRKNEPHAVLIKTRLFDPAPTAAQELSIPDPPAMDSSFKKRKRSTTAPKAISNSTQKAKFKGKERATELLDEDEEITDDTSNPVDINVLAGPRRSRRPRTVLEGGYEETDSDEDIDMDDDSIKSMVVNENTEEDRNLGRPPNPPDHVPAQNAQDTITGTEPGFSSTLALDDDQEEEKPKLTMRVSYQGFAIYERCLCVVVEPWPPLRDTSRATSLAPIFSRGGTRLASLGPSETPEQIPLPLRERTPLFLPDFDQRRSVTPAPLPSRILPPVPLYDDGPEIQDDSDDGDGGMMAFSQALKSMGGERAGSADDNENEGDVFLGDADERRGDA